MLTRDGTRLRIFFDNFRVDSRLPKHRKDDGDSRITISSMNVGSIQLVDSDEGPDIQEGRQFVLKSRSKARPKQGSFWSRLFWRVEAPPEDEGPTMTIPEFFLAVKGSVEKLAIVAERARGYEQAIRNAKDFGQTALVEQLTQTLTAVRAEAHLEEMGLDKYLAEESLVEFVKKCPKGLRLDWVANFTRVIPEEIVAAKKECDTRLIFDNYVILHYDPDGKSWSETEAEKEARRDPVLFGVMQGRNRLYFVGDWVDELCDLTFDQIADTLGREHVRSVAEEHVRLDAGQSR